MTIVDAAGLIGMLAGEPAAGQVEELLDSGDAAITAVGVAEVLDQLERVGRYLPDDLLDALDQLIDAGLTVLPVEAQDGRRAGGLRAQHYHRRTRALSLADCVALAMAINRKARLATSDHVLAALARRVGVDLVALPNSVGQTP